MLQWIDAMPIRDGQTDKCILKQEHTKNIKSTMNTVRLYIF